MKLSNNTKNQRRGDNADKTQADRIGRQFFEKENSHYL